MMTALMVTADYLHVISPGRDYVSDNYGYSDDNYEYGQ
jgi:hypothetical protein